MLAGSTFSPGVRLFGLRLRRLGASKKPAASCGSPGEGCYQLDLVVGQNENGDIVLAVFLRQGDIQDA